MFQSFPRCIFIAILLIGLAACHKDKTTIVKGTVVDKVTGEPLDSVWIEFSIVYDPNDYSGMGTGYASTDANGKFEFSHEKPFSIYGANKSGYLLSGPGLGTGFPKINAGETNDVMVKLTPLDGFLKLVVKNNGPSNKIHVGMYSPLQEGNYGLTFGLAFRDSFYIEQSNESQRVIRLASDQRIDIYWGPTPQPYNLKSLQIQGSVDIVRNDTALFLINF